MGFTQQVIETKMQQYSIKHLILLLLALLLGGHVTAEETAKRIQPNIVLILADDLGYGDMSCYNDQSKVWLHAFIDNDRVPMPLTGPIDKSRLPKHPYANDCRDGLIASDFPIEEVDLVFLKKSREFTEQHVRQTPSKPFFLFHSTQAVHLPSFAANSIT